MKAQALRSLTPGVAPVTCGGAAALMAVWRARLHHAGSRPESSLLSKLRAAAVSLWARPAIVHVHTSARLRTGLVSLLLWLTSVDSRDARRLRCAAADPGKQWRAWILHARHLFLLLIPMTEGRDAFARSRMERTRPRDGGATRIKRSGLRPFGCGL